MPDRVFSPSERGLRQIVALALAVAAIATLVHVHRFAMERFFTVDEYHYGHATWLVAQGQAPYRDFYEHHFPLSYVLHAPLLPGDGSFVDGALRLREVAFAYLVLACALLVATSYVASSNLLAALLAGFVPVTLGFGLMSAIDYRADNFATFTFLACLGLLEANRRWRSGAVAAGCGVLLALSVLMTQKMIFVAGGAVAVLFAIDRLRPRAAPLIVAPALFVAGASAVTAAALASAALMGLLGQGLEITLLQALEHERFHPAVSVWKWARPFFADTAPSTVAILVFATLGAVSSPLWAVPLLVALLGGALVKAQYPYNYVLPCFLIGLCAVRGFAAAIERLPAFRLRPLLYLLPLLVVPDQLGFLERASDNRHQLAILAKIEAHSGPDDAVIDNAGGALFRNHGSYYFVHGGAHRVMFRDYFMTRLVGDYRRSRALFWIHDFRLKRLPPSVRRYFREHYVEADGRLYALGFETPATGVAPTSVVLDVVRAGSYHVFPAERGAEAAARGGLVIRGERVNGGRIDLDEGRVEVTVLPHSQALFVTALPPEVFERTVPVGEPHAKLFEFEPIDPPEADSPGPAAGQE